MAGPGIRFWELAKCLSQENDVTLAVPPGCDLQAAEFKMCSYNFFSILKLIWQHEVIIIPFLLPIFYILPIMLFWKKKIVIDAYNPFHLENLERNRNRKFSVRTHSAKMNLKRLVLHLIAGDYYICASEKQRDHWLGGFSVLGRVSPEIYDQDPTLRKLIDLVPFGLPSNKPVHTKQVLKGAIGGISNNDKVVLWYSGIWHWLDPISAIRAMARIVKQRSDIKFVFVGIVTPDINPLVDIYQPVREAEKLSQELGLLNKYVFFKKDWFPYSERQNYLLEADLVVNLHRQHLETNFAFRTRVLDYFWANLPIISTMGDVLSEMIERDKLGIVVDYENDEQIAAAIIKLIDDRKFCDDCRKNLEQITMGFEWKEVAKPLLSYCSDPEFSINKANPWRILFGTISFYWTAISLMIRMSGFKKVAGIVLKKIK